MSVFYWNSKGYTSIICLYQTLANDILLIHEKEETGYYKAAL